MFNEGAEHAFPRQASYCSYLGQRAAVAMRGAACMRGGASQAWPQGPLCSATAVHRVPSTVGCILQARLLPVNGHARMHHPGLRQMAHAVAHHALTGWRWRCICAAGGVPYNDNGSGRAEPYRSVTGCGADCTSGAGCCGGSWLCKWLPMSPRPALPPPLAASVYVR